VIKSLAIGAEPWDEAPAANSTYITTLFWAWLPGDLLPYPLQGDMRLLPIKE